MLKAEYFKRTLEFRFKAQTSRGFIETHHAYYIKLCHKEQPHIYGIGEASPLEGLSPDYVSNFETVLSEILQNTHHWHEDILCRFPSINFALEVAKIDLANGGSRMIFDNAFYQGTSSIPINGLVWMSDKVTMQTQIREKIEAGYNTIKIKIGALDFDEELSLLKYVRSEYSQSDIVIRLDANGAFPPKNVLEQLKRLSEYSIHSIEQPIRQGQQEYMTLLCRQSPIPIALDEELIAIFNYDQKKHLLKTILPQYIILKPTLLGGFKACTTWIELCNEFNIGWWITSALESNIGLNAIAQYTSSFNVTMPQGLGTGSLYHNNVSSPLSVSNGVLKYDNNMLWEQLF